MPKPTRFAKAGVRHLVLYLSGTRTYGMLLPTRCLVENWIQFMGAYQTIQLLSWWRRSRIRIGQVNNRVAHPEGGIQFHLL